MEMAARKRPPCLAAQTVCSMLEVKSVSPICFNFVKRSKQCYPWISVILGSSNVYRHFQNIPRSSWHHPQDIFQHDDQF
ncbi:unnamed protein product [Sphagnum balticum]